VTGTDGATPAGDDAAPLPVLVVGAGPVGLTLALSLAAHGVRSLVVDDDETVATAGSRAICIQAHTLAILDRLGARAVTEEGVSWNVGRTYYRRRELFSVRLDHGSGRYPGFVNISQARVERLLLDLVEACPLVEVAWRHRVTGLEQDSGGVTVRTAGPGGERSLRAAWVAAADGGRSAVRGLLGVGFPGTSHVDRFLIADVRADLPFPRERRFYFDPPFNRGRQVLVHPQPDRVWRIDWQVPGEVDLDDERRSGRLDARIRQVTGDTPYEVVWISSYVFSQRLAERFRVGRAFLVGDAAHVMSVFGARGLNSGVQDADNLAWKLALVVRGLVGGAAAEALLDSYEAERRPAAAENLRVTSATMRFMAPPDRWARLRRNAILRGSLVSRALRRRVDSGRLSTPYDYAGSPVVGPGGGPVAPDVPVLLAEGTTAMLGDVARACFVAVRPVEGGGDLAAWTRQVAAAGAAAGAAAAGPAVGPAPGSGPEGAAATGPLPVVAAGVDLAEPAERKGYGPGPDVLLVRPDGHLAGRLPPDAEPGALGALLARAVAAEACR